MHYLLPNFSKKNPYNEFDFKMTPLSTDLTIKKYSFGGKRVPLTYSKYPPLTLRWGIQNRMWQEQAGGMGMGRESQWRFGVPVIKTKIL